MVSVQPMAGGGVYDRHSTLQAAASSPAVNALKAAASEVELREPTWIVDYGSSTGKNSIAAIGEAVQVLTRRGAKCVWVVHNDLPENDFSTLFRSLLTTPVTYLGEPHVFAAAVGRSFYERVVPPGMCALGWSAIAAHWLSSSPCEVPDALWHARSALPEVHAKYAEQAARDWYTFLQRRSEELMIGGQLIVLLAGADVAGNSGADHYLDQLDQVLRSLLAEGAISDSEYGAATIDTYFRTSEQLIAPLATLPLRLVEHDTFELANVFWEEAQADAGAYAERYTGWLRAFTEPVLCKAFPRSPEGQEQLMDAVYRSVRTTVFRDPQASFCRWQMHCLRLLRVES